MSDSGVYGGDGNSKYKLDRANTDFALQLYKLWSTTKFENKYDFLKYYQNLTRLFVTGELVDARGILVSYEMGVGKTLTAIAIAIELIKDKPAICLLAKSLQSNMRSSIIKYVQLRAKYDPSFYLCQLIPAELDKWIDRNFSFVSINASNMHTQMNRAVIGNSSNEFDAVLDDKLAELLKVGDLSGKQIIIDEAHNFFRAITNGSANATKVYNAMIKATNLTIIYLTGSPVVNDPYELVPCFNTLGSRQPGVQLFPLNYDEFNKLFVDRNANCIKNKWLFQNRIFGLVSHVNRSTTVGKAIGLELKATDFEFPAALEPIIRRVPMNAAQYSEYLLARDKELEENKRSAGKRNEARGMSKPKSSKSTSYRVKSRSLSNVYRSDGVMVSPKIEAAYEDIKKHLGGLILVYSQFIDDGVGAFAEFLLSKGWKQVSSDDVVGGVEGGGVNGDGGNNDAEVYDQQVSAFIETLPTTTDLSGGYDKEDDNKDKQYKFILYTGEVDSKDRVKIEDAFKDPSNKHGKFADLMLTTSVGAEGLDLKYIRALVQLEPFWNYARFRQFWARGPRANSHIDLPEEERNVQIYLYLSVQPDGENSETLTTDVELYEESINDQVIIDEFTSMINECSIECMVNEGKCRVCTPTNTTLYTSDIYADQRRGDVCTPVSQSQVEAKKITFNDVEYHYVVDTNALFGYKIYVKSEKTDTYIPLKEADPVFMKVLKMIESEVE